MARTKIFRLSRTVTTRSGKRHVVTVVGVLKRGRKDLEIETKMPVQATRKAVVEGTLKYKFKTTHRELTIGYSICHPDDEFDPIKAEEIALKRIKQGNDIGTMETRSTMMLTDDMIMAILDSKVTYICQHLKKFIDR